ncbi:hypothetical protein DUT90_01085 [Polaribacter sp. WD7]|uniref:hypothetical protein n=1 Tax=Polaribacter sp. WD7 TaxID=2269061 RepID=UPI000DF2897C|nr:hypothetical protein [Polaribacter sp. WD7]RCS28415.1 hypothetical protein DUT90_01085 [Polaribacter sp. WD7]
MKLWIKNGLGWGIWMFIAMTFVWPLIEGEIITLKLVIVKFIFWMLAGLIFGYIMTKFQKQRKP